MSRFLTAVLAAAWLATTAMPIAAQDKTPATEKTTAPEKAPAAEKKVSAQQQRMKTCAAKWKDEKAAKNVKGREAYRSFMSGCLKG
ncbi:PsiF family protein [Rhodoplanes roseus]|nr:PsiF family protein [Rhodoplanes roseus]